MSVHVSVSAGLVYRSKSLRLARESCKSGRIQRKLDKAINRLEKYLFSRGKFNGGDDTSIAGLKPSYELTQLWMIDYQPYEADSKVDVWINNCKERLGSHFDKTHIVFTGTVEKSVFKSKS